MTVKQVMQHFEANGFPIYLVGGCVRDQVLDREIHDIDLTTAARPAQIKAMLHQISLQAVPIGEAFGTIATQIEGETVEITTFRQDQYHAGDRHPEVKFGDSLRDDVLRRDFTINTLAQDHTGQIHDFYNGLADLKAGILRTPRNPETTLREDPLRILRAYRFAAQLGFTLDLNLIAAIRIVRDELRWVSAERVLTELNKMLVCDAARVVAVLEMMADDGVLETILPEFSAILALRGQSQGKFHSKDIWKHTLGVVKNTSADLTLRWAALLHDIGKPETRTETADGDVHFFTHEHVGTKKVYEIARRLRFSGEMKHDVAWLVQNHMRLATYESSWTPSAIRRIVLDAGARYTWMVALTRADITSANPQRVAARVAQLDEFEHKVEDVRKAEVVKERLIDKTVVIELIGHFGLQGREIGNTITRLEDAISDGHLAAHPEIESITTFLQKTPER